MSSMHIKSAQDSVTYLCSGVSAHCHGARPSLGLKDYETRTNIRHETMFQFAQKSATHAPKTPSFHSPRLVLPKSVQPILPIHHLLQHTATHCKTLHHPATPTRPVPPATRVTGWRRPIGYLKLQVVFRQRATNYRALLRKVTCNLKHPMGLRHPVPVGKSVQSSSVGES